MTVKSSQYSLGNQYNGSNFVIFGGTGDLAMRMLLPALFYLDLDKNLNDESKIVGVARRTLTRDKYIELVQEALKKFIPSHHLDAHTWERFAQRISYVAVDVEMPDTFNGIKEALGEGFVKRPSIYYNICIFYCRN